MNRIFAQRGMALLMSLLVPLGCGNDDPAETTTTSSNGAGGSGGSTSATTSTDASTGSGSGGAANGSGGGRTTTTGTTGSGTSTGAGGGNADPDVAGRLPTNVPEGFVLHDLGVLPLVDGQTPDFAFESTEQTVAFHVVVIAQDDRLVSLLRVESPDGTEIVSPEPPAGTDPAANPYFAGVAGPPMSPNKAMPRPRAMAALIPNTPVIGIQTGTYTMRAGAFEVHYDDASGQYDNVPLDGKVHVAILERQIPAPASGAIDITLNFAPGSGLDAQSGRSSSSVQDALDQIEKSFASVDIALGTVTYQDAPNVADTIELGKPACLGGEETTALFDAAPARAPQAIQLVFVGAFTCGGPTFLAGISNGIPGIPFASRDGLIVSMELARQYPDAWKLVLAHELGHFLGLHHSVDGFFAEDNIPDTEGANNLMYPVVDFADSDLFTPQQGEVLRLSPSVRPQ